MSPLPYRLRRFWQNLEARATRIRLRDDGADLPAVVVAGAPRSGTTWVAEVLARATRSRLLFEPLAPAAPIPDGIEAFPYLEPGDEASTIELHLRRAFEGRLGGPWVDVRPITARPRGRVVKLVRACLMLGWLSGRFPGVPIVFVTRDPWSVVRSRIRMGWDPLPDGVALVRQPALLRRLGDRAELVRRAVAGLQERRPSASGADASTDADRDLLVEANALLWAVHNRVARDDLADGRAIMLEYGGLVDSPRDEFARVLDGLAARTALRTARGSRLSRASRRLSTTSRGTAPSAGFEQFREEFGPGRAARVAEIAEAFDLGPPRPRTADGRRE